MSRALFVDFADPAGLQAGVEAARRADVAIIDAFTPFPVEGLGKMLGGGAGATRVRIFMAVGGLTAATLAYGLQFYSATIAYPFDVGGRPHNSWPVFFLFPFEFGILAAGICGLLGLFWSTGLPLLNHPVFDVAGIERASADRFVLALAMPEKSRERERLEKRLAKLGALDIREAEL